MHPRLKNSTKWTHFPKELIVQIKGVVNENFQKSLPNAQFFIDGRIYPKEVLFKVGCLKSQSISQKNIWVSCEYDTQKEDVKKILHTVIDCGGSLLAHLIENPDEEFPRSWSAFEFQGQNMYICLDTSNEDLEAQADALLGESVDTEALVQETPPEKD